MSAFIEIDAVRRQRLAGHCAGTTELRSQIADLQTLIARDGPRIESLQLLLDAALMTSDLPTATEAWRLYYGATPTFGDDRRTLGLALAKAKFFTEAELVLRDPCTKRPANDDAAISDVVAYAGYLRRVHDLTDEYYRNITIGSG